MEGFSPRVCPPVLLGSTFKKAFKKGLYAIKVLWDFVFNLKRHIKCPVENPGMVPKTCDTSVDKRIV